MQAKRDLIVLSDCVLDAYYKIESLPLKPEQALASEEPFYYPGGACNVAIVARKLGLDVAVIDKLGKDCFSQILLNVLEQEKIGIKVIFDSEHPTSISNNIFDKKMKHAFIGFSGAGAYLKEDEINEELLLSSRAVFFDGYNLNEKYPAYMAINKAVQKAKSESKFIFFDPGPRRVDKIKQFIELSNVVFFNKNEMLLHLGRDYKSSVEELKNDRKRIYVVKLGARGSICIYDGKIKHIKAVKPKKVIHTIGAGDVYDATFIAFYLKGYSPAVACTLASAMAALKLGAKHVGELPELKGFLKIVKRMRINF